MSSAWVALRPRRSNVRTTPLVSPPVALTVDVFARVLAEGGRADDEDLDAELIADAGCGLVADRGMLAIYAPSIVHMHALGEQIVAERGCFRRKPDHWRTPSDWSGRNNNQLSCRSTQRSRPARAGCLV
jgi:hypothetical protein